MTSKEWRHYIRGLAQNSRPDDMENVLLIDFEAAEATCQSLLEQSSRWEAQALEAEVRIAELEAKCREYEKFFASIARAYGEGPISNTSESQEESAEVVKDELLDAIAIVSLLKLARGRMQHIIESATAGMTHAEVRMTQDPVAQIDAAFDSDPEKPQEGKE